MQMRGKCLFWHDGDDLQGAADECRKDLRVSDW
jgi:hypothetical protein